MRDAHSILVTAITVATFVAACNDHTPNDAAVEVQTDAATIDGTMDDVTADPSDSSEDPSARDFTLRARSMMQFVGRPFNVWVVESTGGHVIGYATTTSIEGDDAELRLPSLVPEGDYRADVFVDGNANGVYDGPAIDSSWSVMIPSLASATAMLSGTDPTVDLNTLQRIAGTTFTAQLTGFDADEVGHRFELRVIDPGSLATVGSYVLPQLTNSQLSVTLPDILDDGTSYNVDFWVDVDGNGVYSGPPLDHTWRVMISSSTMDFTRTDTYTELDWR
jgi:hypothetical protein